MESINPHSGNSIQRYRPETDEAVAARLQAAAGAFEKWKETSFSDRAKLLRAAATVMRDRKAELAGLMADEMGKVIRDGIAEVQKCADCCDYYAEHAHRFFDRRLR